jgi:hypothetical protein
MNGDDWWLLEVNPMPGFAFFDRNCDLLISEMLHRKLCTGYGSFLPIEGQRDIYITGDRLPIVDQGSSNRV